MASRAFELTFQWQGQRWPDIARGLRYFATRQEVALKSLTPVVQESLKGFLDTVALAMEQRHAAPWRANVPGPIGQAGQLYARSGGLVAAIKASVKVDGSLEGGLDIRASIGVPGLRYGRIHEYGGTIYPKNAAFLTVPLPAALDGRGIPLRRSSRDWENTFVIRSRKGNLLIVRRKGKGLEPLYVLKPSVYIPPRLGLGATLSTGVPLFQQLLADRIVEHIVKMVGSKGAG